MLALLLLMAEPAWVEPSRTPPVISACVPANEFVAMQVRTATLTIRKDVFAEDLLMENNRLEEKDQTSQKRIQELQERTDTLTAWLAVAAVVGAVLGLGGAVLW